MTVHDVSHVGAGRRHAGDVERHRAKCREAIRRGLATIIAEQPIIGRDRASKIAGIKIKAYPEPTFQFAKNVPFVGEGGPPVGKDKKRLGRGGKFRLGDEVIPKPGRGAGSDPGEDIYEFEITLDAIDEFLFEGLALPDFLQKRLRKISVIEKGGMVGVTRKGPMARLHRRATVAAQIGRVSAYRRENVPGPEGITDDDLRFRRIAERERRVSNAVVICMMDVSGSMHEGRKFLARAFFWLLYRFVRSEYEHADRVFITHHATAREVDEDAFFHTMESGGTRISTAYACALEVIQRRFPPEAWNIYAFHCSDGDNWMEDNPTALQLAERLLEQCNLFGYGQIQTEEEEDWFRPMFLGGAAAGGAADAWSTLFDLFQPLREKYPNMGFVKIQTREDVYPQFCQLLEKEKVKGGA